MRPTSYHCSIPLCIPRRQPRRGACDRALPCGCTPTCGGSRSVLLLASRPVGRGRSAARPLRAVLIFLSHLGACAPVVGVGGRGNGGTRTPDLSWRAGSALSVPPLPSCGIRNDERSGVLYLLSYVAKKGTATGSSPPSSRLRRPVPWKDLPRSAGVDRVLRRLPDLGPPRQWRHYPLCVAAREALRPRGVTARHRQSSGWQDSNLRPLPLCASMPRVEEIERSPISQSSMQRARGKRSYHLSYTR